MQLQRLAAQLLSCSFLLAVASQDLQQVMTDTHHPISPQTTPKPTLADLLTIESSASIFYSYAREIDLGAIFSDVNARNTLLVPTNKAVMALARKPHQGSGRIGDGIEISEEDFDKASKQNVERWISAHVIPVCPRRFTDRSPVAYRIRQLLQQSPISLSPDSRYPTLLHRKSVTFSSAPDADPSRPEWTSVLLNGEARIVDKKEAMNGVMYLVDGTVSVD
ncbi:hypothetical protein HGRIS_008798 [Hohenbuehelia grisea]|uniref:FAS1 domain-containing protein n=1 Tax=Hohenbuehelia grisea TaxID=104357 RepID=A0ABR3J930_9AGAR